MGLDQYIYRIPTDIKTLILHKLDDEGNDGREEVLYWRKDYHVDDYFHQNYEVENCEDTELTKEDLIKFREFLDDSEEDYNTDIVILDKIIKETDFDKYRIVYHIWY